MVCADLELVKVLIFSCFLKKIEKLLNWGFRVRVFVVFEFVFG